jgi:hypothetical protein
MSLTAPWENRTRILGCREVWGEAGPRDPPESRRVERQSCTLRRKKGTSGAANESDETVPTNDSAYWRSTIRGFPDASLSSFFALSATRITFRTGAPKLSRTVSTIKPRCCTRVKPLPQTPFVGCRVRPCRSKAIPKSREARRQSLLVAALVRLVFWLAELYIVVRLTLADSNAVLLAYYASLRLFSCSYFTYILRSAVAQPNLLARRSRPLTSWVT